MTTAEIFIALGAVIAMVVSLMSCVCFRTKPKNTNADPENKLQESMNNNKNLLMTTSEHENKSNGETDHLDSSKMKNRNTRELPELPPNTDNLNRHGSMGDLTRGYEVVTNQSRHSAYEVRPSDVALDKLKVHTASQRSIDKIKIHAQTASIDEHIDVGPYDESNVYDTAQPSSSLHSSKLNESPPPVPEKRFEQRESAVASTSMTVHPTSAASAVAGIADIPFMTSPVRSAQEMELAMRNRYSDEQIYDENPPNPFYTSISVREPLANIKAQTMCQRYDPEPTYSFVSDDSDQMYAEIQSDQHSAQPPAPPTVESLRTVAQAQHSRQASSSSFASDVTLSHSPTFERNSTTGARTSQATVEELNGMYSTVNKPKKVRPVEDIIVVDPAIEDLYAKVQKTSSLSTGARPKQTINGREFIHTQPMFGKNLNGTMKIDDNLKSSNTKFIHRSSSKDDPNYEKIADTSSWSNLSGPPDCEPASQHRPRRTFKSRLEQKESDPGYETMPVGQSFADYETIGGSYNSDEEIEPGYEKVASPSRSYQRVDPNYESVDYDSVNAPVGRIASEENPYWQIEQRREGEINDPLYERINSRDDDSTDPNYEKVKTISELSYGEASEPGYEQVGQSGSSLNVYEKMNDFDRVLSSGHSDPGYEKIQENRLELHIEWNGDKSTLNSSDTSGTDAGTMPFSDNISPHPVSPAQLLPRYSSSCASPVDNISTYNMVYDDYRRQAKTGDKSSWPEDLDDRETHHYYDERHDSLL